MYKYLTGQKIEGGKITRIYSTPKLLLECSTDYKDDLVSPEPTVTFWNCKFVTPQGEIESRLTFNAMEKEFMKIKIEQNQESDLFCQKVKQDA